MKTVLQEWKSDKLWGALSLGWLLTVVFFFENGGLICVKVPYVGAIFGFRIFLLLTSLLYLAWAIKKKQSPWKNSALIEKWAYVFIAVMLIYGAISLFRAISFERTFKMLFNLSLDMVFFFLAMQLCKDKKLRRATLWVCVFCTIIIGLIGICEVFFGGLVNKVYDNLKRFIFLNSLFQFPVVFSGNTNDYSATLLFCVSIILISFWFWSIEESKFNSCAIPLLAGVFFLLRASHARLCLMAYWILVIGFIISSLLFGKKARKQTALLLVVICCISLCITETTTDLSEEFFYLDETGSLVLKDTGSAGVRAHLLIHCWHTFWDSHGLGAGLGNTGQLAIRNKVAALPTGDGYYESIHCFIARVISDYGVFALIPLCAIAFFLLRSFYRLFAMGIRDRNKEIVSFSIVYFAALLAYPFISTASSDAQDSIAMWFYLAMMVLLSGTIDGSMKPNLKGERKCPELFSLPL